jgi:hypothetical protein
MSQLHHTMNKSRHAVVKEAEYLCKIKKEENTCMIIEDGILFFFLAFTTNLIWFGGQFCHQVVSAPSRSQLLFFYDFFLEVN